MTTPSAQMSARASTARVFRICSGGMYAGEPNIDPLAVIHERLANPDVLEMPKSRTLTISRPSPSRARKKLEGFKSR